MSPPVSPQGQTLLENIIILYYINSILFYSYRGQSSKPDSRSVWTMPSDTGWEFWSVCAGAELADSDGSFPTQDIL